MAWYFVSRLNTIYTYGRQRLAVSEVELHAGRERLGNVVPGTTRNDALLPTTIADERTQHGGKHDLQCARLTFHNFTIIPRHSVHAYAFTN